MSYNKNNQNTGDAIPEMIILKVVDQDSNSIHFRVKWNSKMENLKRKYCEQIGVPFGTLRFLFDGRRVQDDNTPTQLEMENNDTIEVYQEQIGGNTCTNNFNYV